MRVQHDSQHGETMARKANAKRTAARKGGRKQKGLSERETEVLKLLATGVETAPIGRQMGISEKTVRTHIQNILRKLQMHSRVQAVVYAFRNGIVR